MTGDLFRMISFSQIHYHRIPIFFPLLLPLYIGRKLIENRKTAHIVTSTVSKYRSKIHSAGRPEYNKLGLGMYAVVLNFFFFFGIRPTRSCGVIALSLYYNILRTPPPIRNRTLSHSTHFSSSLRERFVFIIVGPFVTSSWINGKKKKHFLTRHPARPV